MTNHDPRRFVSSLSSKLSTRSRHVCIFLGAGVGRSCGLPDVSDLQRIVLDALEGDNHALLVHQLQNNNLEGALSRIRRIATLISGEETVDGLTAIEAEELDKSICQQIARALSIDTGENHPVICLAAWAARASYHLPLESVRRLYVGLQSFRSMSRMDASLMKASALRLRFSQSLASRRQRLSQAMVRSTTQRLGWTTKPFTRSDRLTISVSRSGRMPARAR